MDLKKNTIIESNILYGQKKYFNILIKLYNEYKFPKVLLFSGKKGIGKSTLLIHFLNYVYDKDNYNFEFHDSEDIFYEIYIEYNNKTIIYIFNKEKYLKIWDKKYIDNYNFDNVLSKIINWENNFNKYYNI